MILKEFLQQLLIQEGYLNKNEKGSIWDQEEQIAWGRFCEANPGFSQYSTISPTYENIERAKLDILFNMKKEETLNNNEVKEKASKEKKLSEKKEPIKEVKNDKSKSKNRKNIIDKFFK